MDAFTVQGSYMGGVFVGCLFWGWARCCQHSIQFDFIQFNQFVLIWTPASCSQNPIQFIQQICFDLEIHNSSLLVCFPSDKFGRRPSILIAAVIQVLFQFLSVYDFCRHTGGFAQM